TRRQVKADTERQALHRLLDGAPRHAAQALSDAWEEYEHDESPEARLVHQLDKLEAFMQGCEYAADGRLADPSTLKSFQADGESMISDPLPRALLRALEQWYNGDLDDPAG